MELDTEIVDALRLARKSRQRTILSALAVLACIIMFADLVVGAKAAAVYPATGGHTIHQATPKTGTALHGPDNAQY